MKKFSDIQVYDHNVFIEVEEGDVFDFDGIQDYEISELFISVRGYDFSKKFSIKNIELLTTQPLTELSIITSDLEDISFLIGMNMLKCINLSYNNIKDITPLKDLMLNSLIIHNNKIDDISVFNNMDMTNISDIMLSNNLIADYSPLVHATGLKNFNCGVFDYDDVDIPDSVLSVLSKMKHVEIINSKDYTECMYEWKLNRLCDSL